MKELRNIPGLNPEDIVVIKKYSYKDKSQLLGKCAVLKVNNPNDATIDMENYRIYTLYYGIKEASFLPQGVDKLKAIEDLDADVGEFLFNEIVQHNSLQGMDELKKK